MSPSNPFEASLPLEQDIDDYSSEIARSSACHSLVWLSWSLIAFSSPNHSFQVILFTFLCVVQLMLSNYFFLSTRIHREHFSTLLVFCQSLNGTWCSIGLASDSFESRTSFLSHTRIDFHHVRARENDLENIFVCLLMISHRNILAGVNR